MLLIGSALIGVAAGLLMLFTGKVMGASGMIGNLLGGAEGLAATSIAFIAGIVAGPFIMTSLDILPRIAVDADLPLLVLGGLLVGFGARFGGASVVGAVTGMARRSKQSVVVFVVMALGACVAVYGQALLGGITT